MVTVSGTGVAAAQVQPLELGEGGEKGEGLPGDASRVEVEVLQELEAGKTCQTAVIDVGAVSQIKHLRGKGRVSVRR